MYQDQSKSSTVFKNTVLHWAYRGSQELLPQAAPLKWLKVNKQETLVLSRDRSYSGLQQIWEELIRFDRS